MDNIVLYFETWAPFLEAFKAKLGGRSITTIPSVGLGAHIVVRSALDGVDLGELVEKEYEKTIEMSNCSDADTLYLCCQRMAELCQGRDFGLAGVWLGLLCEKYLESYGEAQYWYNKAAQQKCGIGMYRVGLLYLNKRVPVPKSTSVERCFRDALSCGVQEAQAIIDEHFTDKTNTSRSAQNQRSEFDNDIMELVSRDDIQCQQDICEAEYQKAMSLLQNPTRDTVRRAYDLMGNLASRFVYVPAIMWMGDFAENTMEDTTQAARWYKKAADLGDGNGARCYADMLITGNGVEKDTRKALHYYADAADKGIPEAAFVLGEYFRNKGDQENAIKAYMQAYNGGYTPAKTRIDQMKNR